MATEMEERLTARRKALADDLPENFAAAQQAWRKEFPKQADRIIELVRPLYDPNQSFDLRVRPEGIPAKMIEEMKQAVTWRSIGSFAKLSPVIDLEFLGNVRPRGGSIRTLGWSLMDYFQRDVATRLPEDQVATVLATLQETLYSPLHVQFYTSFGVLAKRYIPPIEKYASEVDLVGSAVQRNLTKIIFFSILAELLDDPTLHLKALYDQHLQGVYLLGFDRHGSTAYVLDI